MGRLASNSDHRFLFGLSLETGASEEVRQVVIDRAVRGVGGWIVTLNLEMVSRMVRSRQYRELLSRADLHIADGMPLVWASRMYFGASGVRERIAGVDLVADLLRSEDIHRIAVVGGRDVAQTLSGLQPPDVDSYIFEGRVTTDELFLRSLCLELEQRAVQIVFLALGVPKQDIVAEYLRRRLAGVVVLGVGGAFDLLGGAKRRAPVWMQRCGLEWLFRLKQEPRRLWRRYLLLYPVGAVYILRSVLSSYFSRASVGRESL